MLLVAERNTRKKDVELNSMGGKRLGQELLQAIGGKEEGQRLGTSFTQTLMGKHCTGRPRNQHLAHLPSPEQFWSCT